MFYVEVVLEPNGDIKDVKIHHENNVEQQVYSLSVMTSERFDSKRVLKFITVCYFRIAKN